jgi:hypothetical protein
MGNHFIHIIMVSPFGSPRRIEEIPMAEPANPPNPSAAEVRVLLVSIAQFLRQAHRMGPETQMVLADYVEELGKALEENDISTAEIARLTQCASHLLDAVHDEEPGVLEGARNRLERTVVAMETQAPMLAGLLRRLSETLSNLGI